MMDKNNKKGFTLVELIVVIAIVAALSVSLGVNSVQTMKDTRIKDYRDSYSTIFNAAMLYTKLKAPSSNCKQTGIESILCPTTCAKMNSTATTSCDIPICCLIESGLLDENYLTQYDPLTEEEEFSATTIIHTYYSNNILYAKVEVDEVCASGGYITSETVDDYENFEMDCLIGE